MQGSFSPITPCPSSFEFLPPALMSPGLNGCWWRLPSMAQDYILSRLMFLMSGILMLVFLFVSYDRSGPGRVHDQQFSKSN